MANVMTVFLRRFISHPPICLSMATLRRRYEARQTVPSVVCRFCLSPIKAEIFCKFSHPPFFPEDVLTCRPKVFPGAIIRPLYFCLSSRGVPDLTPSSESITKLLVEWREGDQTALDRL